MTMRSGDAVNKKTNAAPKRNVTMLLPFHAEAQPPALVDLRFRVTRRRLELPPQTHAHGHFQFLTSKLTMNYIYMDDVRQVIGFWVCTQNMSGRTQGGFP